MLKVVQGIYQIRNTLNGHSYIGSSSHVYRRWAGHRHKLRRGRHANPILQAAWSKYGEAAFEWRMLEVVPDHEQLLVREALHMAALKPAYNISKPDEETLRIGAPLSDEAKTRISQANKGRKRTPAERALMSKLAQERGISDEVRVRQRQAATGRPRSPETKAKIALARTGLTLTDEAKAKISRALTGRCGRRHSPSTKAKIGAARSGKSHTEESRAKMSVSRKGKALTPEHRAKIGASQVGRQHSEETKAKIGAGRRGKRHTEEAKARISAARRARMSPPVPLATAPESFEVAPLPAIHPSLAVAPVEITPESTVKTGHID